MNLKNLLSFGNSNQKDKTAVHAEAEVKKGIKPMGKMKIYPGHTLFMYNPATGELKEAEIETKEIIFTGAEITTSKRVKHEQGWQYFGFLNRKSAIKKLNKYGFKVIE